MGFDRTDNSKSLCSVLIDCDAHVLNVFDRTRGAQRLSMCRKCELGAATANYPTRCLTLRLSLKDPWDRSQYERRRW
jgi:hypothetical protein